MNVLKQLLTSFIIASFALANVAAPVFAEEVSGSFDGSSNTEIDWSDYFSSNSDQDQLNVDWSQFFADLDQAFPEPQNLSLLPTEVNQGQTVYVVLFSDDQQTEAADLPEGWDIKVWTFVSVFPNIQLDFHARYSDDDFEKFGNGRGVYTVNADFEPAKYYVSLYNADGEVVGNTQSFTVKAEAELDIPQFDVNIPEFSDSPDINFDVDDDAEAELDVQLDFPELVFDTDRLAGLFDEDDDQVEVQICADLNEDFWGYDIVVSLLGDQLFPLLIDGDRVNCRVEQEVLRKEFTYWLMTAYQVEAIADIDEFHNNYDYDNSPFSDVDGDDPYDPYIIMANQLGIINGNPDGTFRGDTVINRAEVLKILLRSSAIFEASDAEIDALEDNYADYEPEEKFADEDDDDWYTPYLHYAAAKGIIEGRQYSVAGNVIMKSDMAAGVKYGEAGKILYLAQELEANGQGQLQL